MNRRFILLVIPLLSFYAVIQAVDYSLPWHVNEEISAAGYVLDEDSDGEPICGDYAIYRLADTPIQPKYVSDMDSYHPVTQVEGIKDENGNGWPDYCESRGATTGTVFTNNIVFHSLTELTTGSGPGDVSMDSNENGCFDYCDCLPGEFTGAGCYDNDVYDFVCGARGSKITDCGESGYGLNHWDCDGTDLVEYRDYYDRYCLDGSCYETLASTEELQRISCLSTVCGAESLWSCDGACYRVKYRTCTYGTCSNYICEPGPPVQEISSREACPPSYVCMQPKCIGCEATCVFYRGLTPIVC